MFLQVFMLEYNYKNRKKYLIGIKNISNKIGDIERNLIKTYYNVILKQITEASQYIKIGI